MSEDISREGSHVNKGLEFAGTLFHATQNPSFLPPKG